MAFALAILTFSRLERTSKIPGLSVRAIPSVIFETGAT